MPHDRLKHLTDRCKAGLYKRNWSKYNPSLVKRIEVLLDTSFLKTWKEDLEKENEGKVGRPYEYPQGFLVLLSQDKIPVERTVQGTGGVRQESLETHRQIPPSKLCCHIPED